MKARQIQTKKKEPRSGKRSGFFITLEGIEGCGKTTQSRALACWLRTQGYKVLETREPGGTPLAEEIRALLLNSPSPQQRHQRITPVCEAALVLASRSHHVAHKIRPALSQGHVVVCDRFSDSTLAYQGYGRGLNIGDLEVYNDFVTSGLTPDLTLLFDLPVKQGLARRQKTRNQNRLDRESLSFHERVRRGFLALASKYPKRLKVLDGRSSTDIIAFDVQTITRKIMALKFKSQSKHSQLRHRTRKIA